MQENFVTIVITFDHLNVCIFLNPFNIVEVVFTGANYYNQDLHLGLKKGSDIFCVEIHLAILAHESICYNYSGDTTCSTK